MTAGPQGAQGVSSPYVRGWTVPEPGKVYGVMVFPVCTGMVQRSPVLLQYGNSVPHM